MVKSISDIVDKLFEEMPYTKEHEEAKKKIYSALEKEYRRFIDSGKTDIQALGEIMLVNAFFILLVFLVNCSGILERAIVANMSADELIVLMCGNVDILAAAVFIFLYHTFITHAVLNGVSGNEKEDFKE